MRDELANLHQNHTKNIMDTTKVLIADRDRITAQTVESILKDNHCEPTTELSKDDAIRRISEENFPFVIVDPSPQPNPRPSIIAFRRNASMNGCYTYITVASRDKTFDDSLDKGANNFIKVPIKTSELTQVINDGKRFLRFYNFLRETETKNDIPCDGTIMGSAALTQVLLSSIDRADRYGERTYLLHTEVEYLAELKDAMGADLYQSFYTSFTNEVIRARRQSDLFGRLKDGLYSFIMQRPINDREPVDAAARMQQNLQRFLDNATEFAHFPIRMTMRSMAIPTGKIVADLVVCNEAGATLEPQNANVLY